MKKILISGTVLALAIMGVGYFYMQNARPCLEENEVSEYKIDDQLSRATSTVTVFVKNKGSVEVLRQFTEPILQAGHYHPVELRPCHAYFIQGTNINVRDPGNNPVGFRSDLISLDYSGNLNRHILLSEKPDEYKVYFTRDFRVSPSETFVALENNRDLQNKIFLIKNLRTREDVFTTPLATIVRENENLVGDMMFLDWTRDGRYFWASLFEAAYVNGWIRVDSKDWSYELYEAPEGVLGGYPLNIETGWVPVIPGAFWTGVVELDDEVKQERSASGETADLYLYNVITKTRIIVEDTNAPIWRGLKAKWLSDTELEYTMPSGERKIYRVE